MSNKIELVLPILKGNQDKYDKLRKENQTSNKNIYICEDSGNLYIGDKPLAKDVYFAESKEYLDENAPLNSKGITPFGIYVKILEHKWDIYSNWYIDSEGFLYTRSNKDAEFKPIEKSIVVNLLDESPYNATKVVDDKLYTGAIRTSGKRLLNPENVISWDLKSTPNLYIEITEEPESSRVSLSLDGDMSELKDNNLTANSLLIYNFPQNSNNEIVLDIEGMDIIWNAPLPKLVKNKVYKFDLFSSIKSEDNVRWFGRWSEINTGVSFSEIIEIIRGLENGPLVYKVDEEV